MIAIEMGEEIVRDAVSASVAEVRREAARRGGTLDLASVQQIAAEHDVARHQHRPFVDALIEAGLVPLDWANGRAVNDLAARAPALGVPEPSRASASAPNPVRARSASPSERLHQHPLLTASEEYELGCRMAAGQLARQAIEDGFEVPPHRQAAVKRQLRDADDAAEKLLLCNIRLVAQLAKRYERSLADTDGLLDYDDLLTEGILGLHRAVRGWDHTRGLKFSTYATWWVRQSLQRAVDNYSRTVRLPVYLHEDLRRLRRAKRELEDQRRVVTAELLASSLGWSGQKVVDLWPHLQLKRSLDEPVGEAGSRFGELLADPSMEDPAEHAALADFDRVLRQALAGLPEPQQFVLLRRIGLFGHERMTLEEIGVLRGVTRERIRQIESKALNALRPALVRKGFLTPSALVTEEGAS